MEENKFIDRYAARKRTLVPAIRPAPAVDEARLANRSAYLATGAVPAGVEIIHTPAYPPLKHQIVAYDSAVDAKVFAFLMEMSTFKTGTTLLVAAERARRKGSMYRMLVVAPKTVCGSWVDEIAKHCTVDANVEILRGTARQRSKILEAALRDRTSPMVVVITNYEGVVMLEPDIKSAEWDLMVCDESTWIKNPSAKRSKACQRVGRSARSRLILTGTPITKNILDLYGQFHFLEPGLLGFTSLYAYQNYYANLDFFGSYRGYKPDRLPELMDRIARLSFILRRAQCIDLPPKVYKTITVEMGKEQRAAYDMMLDRAIVDLEREEAEEKAGILQARGASPVSKLVRLAQITSGYLPDEEGGLHEFSPNPKIEAVEEYFEALPDEDKLVIWARFRYDLDLLMKHFKDHGAVTIHGGTSDKDRDEARRRFRDDPSCRVFIGQPQAGGYGLNELIAAAHCVYFSNDWIPRGQSEDRLHRYGQTRTVTYVDIVVPDTVDELVLSRVQEKTDLLDLLMDRRTILEALRVEKKKRG